MAMLLPYRLQFVPATAFAGILKIVAILGLLSSTVCAQCREKMVPPTAGAPKPKLYVLMSERLFSAINRTDAAAALKIWGELVTCLQHLDVETKVEMIDAPQELRQRVINRTAHVLIVDSVEFIALSDAGLVEGAGVASSDGQPLAPAYVLLVNSQMDSLSQLRGKRAVFYMRTASAASVAWMSILLANQHLGNVEGFFSSAEISTNPSNCILPLFFGRIDACVIDSRNWGIAREMNPQLQTKLKVLTQSVAVLSGVAAVPKFPIDNRQQVVESLFQIHKYPVGQQILTVFRSGPIIPYRPEYIESTRQFWTEYERTLSPAQLKQWNLSLLPILPAQSQAASGAASKMAAVR